MNKYIEYYENKIKDLRNTIHNEYNIDLQLKEMFIHIKFVKYDKSGIIVDKENMLDKELFYTEFEILCKEGKSWVHLTPLGVINNEVLLYEYNYAKQNVSYDTPFINWSIGIGPNIIIK